MYYLKKGNPDMYQSHYQLYRVADSKLLGELIKYSRRGGDVPGPWHLSSFGCLEEIGFNDLEKQIFYKDW
jgi:hypothetical protein